MVKKERFQIQSNYYYNKLYCKNKTPDETFINRTKHLKLFTALIGLISVFIICFIYIWLANIFLSDS